MLVLEALLLHSRTFRKFSQCEYCVKQDLVFRQKIGDDAVLAALSNPTLLEQQVGLGEITDPTHPCMRESVASARLSYTVSHCLLEL